MNLREAACKSIDQVHNAYALDEGVWEAIEQAGRMLERVLEQSDRRAVVFADIIASALDTEALSEKEADDLIVLYNGPEEDRI